MFWRIAAEFIPWGRNLQNTVIFVNSEENGSWSRVFMEMNNKGTQPERNNT
ncbi:hypothetical protein LINPERHAP1_LOCUS3450 [Linum perenne]